MADVSSPKRASLKLSQFSGEQVTWVIFKFVEMRNVMAVKRAFANHFFKKNPRMVLTTMLLRG